MAKKISDEIINLKIIVNGDEAQTRVANLEKENNKLVDSLNEQKKVMSQLSKQRKKDSDEYKKAEAEVKKLSNAIAENNKKIDAEVKSMNVMNLTMQQLQKRANDLRFTMNHMAPGTEAYKKAQDELSRLNTRMSELRLGVQGAKQSIGDLADKFNRYSGMAAAVLATATGIGLSIQSTIDINNKLADAQTAVAKTTGLMNEEVKELTKSFSEFDTRTKKIDLLKIAEIGGRLGVPKEEIKEFVREIDKAYVALGDSFSGGVEAVANKLGKIKGLFKETKELDIPTAVNQIGSSLNELGASGAASEENIAEFTLRVGALPNALKPTVADAMALGAAFEESGIDAERSATAYSNFVKTAATDVQKFANVMNKPVEEVKKLINSNPTEFFLKFSEGMKNMDATQVAQILDYLKLNDQYITSIVGAAAENTDLFRKSMLTSNDALREATSLQEEFNKVNNNAAALYDKVAKKFAAIFSSESVANTLNWLIEFMGRLLGVVDDTGQKVDVFMTRMVFLSKIFYVVTMAVAPLSIAMSVYNGLVGESAVKNGLLATIEKARAFRLQILNNLQNAFNLILGYSGIAISKVTGFLGAKTVATNIQTVAQQRLNAVTQASPWGAVIALIGLAVSAYMTYSAVVGDSAKKQKELNDVMREATKEAGKEISELERLYKAATDASKGKDKQREAVEKLQKLYPSYFGQMSQEEIMAGRLKGKYLELRNAILAAAQARAIEDKIKELTSEKLDLQEKTNARFQSNFNNRQNLRKYSYGGGDTGTGVLMSSSDDEIKKSHDDDKRVMKEYLVKSSELNNQINNYIKRADALAPKFEKLENDRKNQNAIPAGFSGGSAYSIPEDSKKTGKKSKDKGKDKEAEQERKKYENEKKKILDDAEKWNEKLIDLEIRDQEQRLELMKDGYEKELDTIIIEQDKKIQALEKEKISKNQFNTIDRMIAREPEGGQDRASLESLKERWLKHNSDLEKLQMQEMEISALKIRALRDKYDLEDLKKKEQNHERELRRLKTTENEKIAELDTIAKQKEFLADKISERELEKITNWEEGKKAIQKYYQEESLALQKEYLAELVKELESIPPASLTEEQIEVLERLRSKLGEIGVEIAGIKNGGNSEEDKFSALSGFGGNVDIFGLSPEQWELMFENTDKAEQNIQKIGAAIRVTQNMMNTYYSFIKANQEAELRRYEVAHDRKKRKLEAQLAAGIISQQEYKHQTIAIENELAMKKYQLELDAAKREKAIRIADVVSNTAMAIMTIWSKKSANPVAAGILTGIVTALGAVQVATIASQPLPQPPSIQGAEDGYYPVFRKQDGKLFNAKRKESVSGLYDEPTMLVGEQGKNFPELVVSGNAMKKIDPKIQSDFMTEVARVEGFEKGLYPQTTTASNNDEMYLKMAQLLSRNIDVLERLEQNGVRGVFEKNARTGKDLEEMQKEYRRLVDKNKH